MQTKSRLRLREPCQLGSAQYLEWIHDSKDKSMEETMLKEQAETTLSITAKMIPSPLLFIPIMILPLIRLGILRASLHSNNQSTALIKEIHRGNKILTNQPIRFLCIIMEASRTILTKCTRGTRHHSTILVSTRIRAMHFLPLHLTVL